MRFVIIILVITLFPLKNFSQNYTSPLDFKLLLSGTFGELRSNHFHAGIDFKTQGVEGQNVRSIADGYISRIKVSTWGYGKVIYINHPETGHTSVYAHLSSFNETINQFVKNEHYKRESFELDLYLKENEINVKQGEIIGLSGNTGGSNGAHLHFEIRETNNAHPINPLQYDFDVTDNIAPILKKIKLYAIDTTLINGYNSNKVLDVMKLDEGYFLNENITVSGNFALGIFTYDQSDGAYNKNGVYSIKLYVDNEIYYSFQLDELNFNTTRFINAHIDYCEKIENQIKFHRCHKLPHNKLKNYNNLKNNGIIKFNDSLVHKIKIEVSDIFGNISKLNFDIKSTPQPFTNKCLMKKDSLSSDILSKKYFNYNTPNFFKNKDIYLNMDAYSLYESIFFEYRNSINQNEVFGNIHHIHYNNTPVHKYYTLSLSASVPKSLLSKTYIAKTDIKGKYKHIGGKWKNNQITTKTREFGDFCIVSDTINPEIIAINIHSNKKITNQKTIDFKIKDNESGIKSFRGEIDNKWILMDYDYKTNLLRYKIEDLQKGEHVITLNVVDKLGNSSKFEAQFTF